MSIQFLCQAVESEGLTEEKNGTDLGIPTQPKILRINLCETMYDYLHLNNV